MEKGSNSVKIEKIRRCMEAQDYSGALELAKTVDAARLKSASDLSVLAEAYYKNGVFDVALVYYEQIYQKTPLRRILFQMITLCIKLSMTDMAVFYLRAVAEMAPEDYYRHIFRYQIDKQRGEALDVLIYDLECLKEENYMEEWAYELAKLYYKDGQTGKCVEECDDLILWFGCGIYVERARGLRAINMDGTGLSTERDEKLVREVYQLMAEGRSIEAVETFIEESTTPEGYSTELSDADYRNERYSEPVYEETGREVEWKTNEFGKVSEQAAEIQNTMDLLRGMQVADQIRMQLGEGNEMELAEPEVKQAEETLEENLPKDTVLEEKETNHADEVTEDLSVEVLSFPEETEADAETETAKEAQDASEPDSTRAETGKVRKSLWQRRKEAKEKQLREKEEKERRKREERERALEKEKQENIEVEESIYRILQEEEREEELSRSVREVTDAVSQEGRETQTYAIPEEYLEPEPKQSSEDTSAEQFAEKTKEPEATEVTEVTEATAEPEAPVETTAPENADNPETPEIQTQPEAPALYQYPRELNTEPKKEEAPEFFALLEKRGLKASDFFAEYMVSANTRKQLLRSLEQLLNARKHNVLLMITGEEPNRRIMLAKAVIKCLHELGHIPSSRVAVIDAKSLNRMQLREKKEQLEDATMIVERASEMDDAHVAELLMLTPDFAGKTGVILVDERSRINQLLRRNNEMNVVFNNRIHLTRCSEEELFLAALSGLALHDYQMDEEVAECFLERVREEIEENRENPYEAVHEYTEKVISAAERRMAEMLRIYAREGRYQEADLLRLAKEDL